MRASSAKYLLRFDDLCPTMDRARWQRFVPLIQRFGLRPILAVVPENCDPDLNRDPPYADFWAEMRQFQASGAAIGLHGFRHVCQARGRSLIQLHSQTEFSGVDEPMQREWIRSGLGKLREEGLEPRIWVAPRHGFDPTTLRVLRGEGIAVVSDGFASKPFRDFDMVWIPQQLWEPVEKHSGLWTICLHSNSATDEQVRKLESFLAGCAAQFTSVDEALAGWPLPQRSLADRAFHARLLLKIRANRLCRRRGIRHPKRAGSG